MTTKAATEAKAADLETFDVVVVGGGPAGATAAERLAAQGWTTLLLDRAGRVKPCGGAIPPRLVRDFAIPDALMVAKVTKARIVAPSGREVPMDVRESKPDGYVGMVDRDTFDEWLRERAARAGAERRSGTFKTYARGQDGLARIVYQPKEAGAEPVTLRARMVVGADGARSRVAAQAVPGGDKVRYVVAYHEIIAAPPASAAYDPERCDVIYDGKISPDFYGWVFPHGAQASVGMGTERRDVDLRAATAKLRAQCGLTDAKTIREEGAPIPLKPLKRWDNGRDVVLAGDAAGVVAPASGEGIYYAMLGGQLAAEAAHEALASADPRALAQARKRFMRDHGRVFWILGMMQWFWYASDARRERFVTMCDDPDVQRFTWVGYMDKQLVRSKPAAHARIFFKDLGHLLGLVSPSSR